MIFNETKLQFKNAAKTSIYFIRKSYKFKMHSKITIWQYKAKIF